MEPYQQRVVEERVALADKVKALGAFIEGETYAKLEAREQRLLRQQFQAMNDYLSALSRRIMLWENR